QQAQVADEGLGAVLGQVVSDLQADRKVEAALEAQRPHQIVRDERDRERGAINVVAVDPEHVARAEAPALVSPGSEQTPDVYDAGRSRKLEHERQDDLR